MPNPRFVSVNRVFGYSLALAFCAAGLAIGAQPSLSWQATNCCNPGDALITESVDIDFSKSSSAFPSRNFPTWNSLTGTGVRYFDIPMFKDATSAGCYELKSTGASADDVIIFYKNVAGVWTILSDDHGGNHQFRARYAVLSQEDHFLRISPYNTTQNNGNNAGVVFSILKINADPFNTNTADPNSCRVANIPYYRRAFNNDLPYLAP